MDRRFLFLQLACVTTDDASQAVSSEDGFKASHSWLDGFMKRHSFLLRQKMTISHKLFHVTL